ncbi:MAG TPA: hypothetical protein VGQ52_14685 [Gemmatimonadaceae bacterium]|jgi:hypothetical protein|nr:hypothetical protein [Gemmatimonadaceae bacterium]
MSTGSTVRRGLAVVVLTLAAAALGTGFAFWRAGPEMVVMTLIFGGSGIYLFIEGLGLLILTPRRRKSQQLDEGRAVEQQDRQRGSRAA